MPISSFSLFQELQILRKDSLEVVEKLDSLILQIIDLHERETEKILEEFKKKMYNKKTETETKKEKMQKLENQLQEMFEKW